MRHLIAIIITIFTAAAIFIMGKREKRIPPKVAACIIGLEVTGSIMSLMSGSGNAVVKRVKRPEAGASAQEREITARSGEKEEKIQVSVSERKLTDTEAVKAIDRAEKELRKGYLGENEKSTEVYRDLNLESSYCKTVTAEWETSPTGIFDSDGVINNAEVDEPTEAAVRCLLTCEEESRMVEFHVTAVPVPADAEMGFKYYLDRALAEADEKDPNSRYVSLPAKVNGQTVRFTEKQEDDGLKLVILMAVALGLYIFYMRYRQKDLDKKRQKEISLDYPKMVSQLSMYIGAGFSVRQAFMQVGNAYAAGRSRGHPEREAFEAVLRMNRKIKDGEDEESAINALGDSLQNKGFRKLTLLLAQSRRKGNAELRDQMEQEERESYDRRRMDARVAGEEASLKLLMPMMGLLGVIFIVLLVPAFMQMG